MGEYFQAEGQTFDFPDIESKIPASEDVKQLEEATKKMDDAEEADKMKGVPNWFR